MDIRIAKPDDLSTLIQLDRHISPRELETSVRLGRVYVAEEQGKLLGWLRYNLFWDNTPFLNLLYILEDQRGKGLGRALTDRWEARMKQANYETVLTSTQSSECAQHFYYRLGYTAVGGFFPPGESYELILAKKL